jgi:F-type H+-transporting ATPase subunit b
VSPSVATFLFEAANFLVLAVLLGWFFFRPVRAALERRRAELEAERRQAAEQLAQAERELAALRQQQRDFEASLEARRAESHRQAEAEVARLVADGKEQARREQERARGALTAQRRALAQAGARDAAAAAADIVAHLLERIGGLDLDGALVRAACRELGALAAHAAPRPALVEAARSLDDANRAQLAQALGCAPGEVEVRIVPELAAGVRVVTPAGLIDASAAGLAAFAERALLGRLDAEEADRG